MLRFSAYFDKNIVFLQDLLHLFQANRSEIADYFVLLCPRNHTFACSVGHLGDDDELFENKFLGQ